MERNNEMYVLSYHRPYESYNILGVLETKEEATLLMNEYRSKLSNKRFESIFNIEKI